MLNKVQFIGHVGRDPEIKYLPNGDAVCNFSVASSERWKDKSSGEMQERTEWLSCSAFQRLAEVCGEYLKKGSLVYVEGKLQTRKYEDKDGVTKYITECRIDQMKMLGGRDREGGGEGGEQRQQRASAPAPQRQQAPAKSGGGYDDMDDDIPF